MTTAVLDAPTDAKAIFKEFAGPLHWVVPQRFFAPNCTCVVGYQYTFHFSDDYIRRVDPLLLSWMAEQHQFNEVTAPTATGILRQCDAHQHLVGAKSLFAEVWHFHGNKHGPYPCGCTFHVWFDDRVSQAEQVQTPVEHDTHTHRCPKHIRLNTVDHYLTLIQRPTRIMVQKPEQDRTWQDFVDAGIINRPSMVPTLAAVGG